MHRWVSLQDARQRQWDFGSFCSRLSLRLLGRTQDGRALGRKVRLPPCLRKAVPISTYYIFCTICTHILPALTALWLCSRAVRLSGRRGCRGGLRPCSAGQQLHCSLRDALERPQEVRPHLISFQPSIIMLGKILFSSRHVC